MDKEQRQRYLASRATEAEEMTAEVQETMDSLRSILAFGLKSDPRISFASLLMAETTDPFRPPAEFTATT
jgi:hypothetical protein